MYVVNCLIAHRWKTIKLKQAALYVVSMAMMGLVGETAVNSVYHFVFGKPLWTYTVYPIHHDYTSQYAALLWGAYGLYLYLLHGQSGLLHKISLHKIAFIFAFESVLIEALVNITYKLTFGHYIFYYWPRDLWHFTTVQALPFYWLCGYILFTAFRKFEKDPKFFTCLAAGIGWVVAFLTT